MGLAFRVWPGRDDGVPDLLVPSKLGLVPSEPRPEGEPLEVPLGLAVVEGEAEEEAEADYDQTGHGGQADDQDQSVGEA